MDAEAPTDDPYDYPGRRARVDAFAEQERKHKRNLAEALSELQGDIRSAFSLALECVDHYDAIADHDGNRDSWCIRPHHRTKILTAVRAIWDEAGWYRDDVRENTTPFNPDLLRALAECRRSGPGPFRPEHFYWISPTFRIDLEGPREFDSAFALLDLLLLAAGEAIVASCPPCSGSLAPGWVEPAEYVGRPPDHRFSGGSTRLELLDFNFLIGRRAVLPTLNRMEIEAELAREARALAVARQSGVSWFGPRSIEINIQTPISGSGSPIPPHPDGPAPPDVFWYEENDSVVARPLVWRLINALWSAPDRTRSFDELGELVWRDREHLVDANGIGSLRRDANRFFDNHSIPFRVGVKNRFCTMHSR